MPQSVECHKKKPIESHNLGIPDLPSIYYRVVVTYLRVTNGVNDG